MVTHPWADDDKLHEECAIFGIFGHAEAAKVTALGLHALQHRGEEATGIASFDGAQLRLERRLGLVSDALAQEEVLSRLPGNCAIGHNRYSTTGESGLRNIQPLYADLVGGGIAVAHNGNLTNAQVLRDGLVRTGSIFQSTSDTEVLVHLIARSGRERIVDRIIHALHQVEGAYSLTLLTKDRLIGVRDPLGVRPLCIGRLGDSWVLASETCALNTMGARYMRDVEPGEMVVISSEGLESLHPFPQTARRFCIFEYVYFSRADSSYEGRSVYDVRKRIGAELAKEAPVDADVVVPVPDSGMAAALGYAEAAGIPFQFGIIRNQYEGRSFILPEQSKRQVRVRRKLNPVKELMRGRRVILVDDSVVRGTTSNQIVQMVRDAGAEEVHFRVASPPTMNPCFYGVDTPDRDQLLAATKTMAEMQTHIAADTLAFVSIDGLYRAVGEKGRDNQAPQYCDACFTGAYPTRLTDRERTDEQLSLLPETETP